MQAGRLEQLDTPENVYRRPATPFVAEFVGAMNRLPGRIGDAGDVQVLGQRLTVLNADGRQPGAAVEALLRPEAVAVVPDAAGPGEVTQRTFLGSAVRLEVTLDGGQKVLVECSEPRRHRRGRRSRRPAHPGRRGPHRGEGLTPGGGILGGPMRR